MRHSGGASLAGAGLRAVRTFSGQVSECAFGFRAAPVSGCWGTRRGRRASPPGSTLEWTSLSPSQCDWVGFLPPRPLCRVVLARGPSPPGCTPPLQGSRDQRPQWAALPSPPRGCGVRGGLARPRAPVPPWPPRGAWAVARGPATCMFTGQQVFVPVPRGQAPCTSAALVSPPASSVCSAPGPATCSHCVGCWVSRVPSV